MATVRYGQIVLVNVSDGHGNRKNRPVVIVTPTSEIAPDGNIVAVCISTQIEDPMSPEHVKLPWSTPRHPRTGLNKPNVAKCDWTVSFLVSDVIKVMGTAPYNAMSDIARALARLTAENEKRRPT